MKNVLTFVIPVRHQDNARDWQTVKRNLGQTVRSIAAQQSDGWKAIIIANHGADLPELPKGFQVVRVDYAPNPLFEQGSADKETFYQAVRLDKGRRILAGMLNGGDMGHIMVVDDDDFISNKLTSFVAGNSHANGWYVRDGYIWTDGSWVLYRFSDFSLYCGSSHIIRGDLYRLPSSADQADETYIRRVLGSHRFLHDYLDSTGTPLEPLPFYGAVYRIGHVGAHSRSTSMFEQYFWHKDLYKQPLEFCSRLLRLRPKIRRIDEEFFGSSRS